jgi:DNA polymerase I-like protein with 3'-5' exonuclease and polymerase domains
MEEREVALKVADEMLPTWYFPKTKKSFDEVPHKVLKNKPNRNHWGRDGVLDPGVPYTEVRHLKLEVTRDDIALYLRRTYGWKPTQRTKTGKPKVDDEVLRGLPWPEAQAFADYFKVDKVIGYMNSEIQKNGRGGGWLHHVTQEGKLHAGFIPLTAVTGRPSCVAPNLQQVPTDGRVRQLFGARPGWKLVGVDADGQELRCLGHYLYPYDSGEYAREVVEGDIHSRVQKLIGFHTRDGTKPAEYGLIYGAGNPKLGLIALQDALSAGKVLTVPLGTRGKQIREAIMSGITGFEELLNDVRLAASHRRRLRGLDGRTLWVRSPHSALNLLLQSAGIIHMKQAIAIVNERLDAAGLVEDEDYGLVLWVHDELQFEARPDVAEEVGKIAAKAIEDAAVMLKFRVPMTGTYQIGDNWKETH